jgi:transposase-like protein
MPFQREDITIDERVQIVASLLAHPRPYGLVSQVARTHGLSRQSLYTWLAQAEAALAASLAARPPGRPAPSGVLAIDQNRLERAIITLTVAGHASLAGVPVCLEELLDTHRSTGYISGVLAQAGDAAHAWREHLAPAQPLRADLDEVFIGHTPQLVIVDPDSLLILALEQTPSRDSTAWGVTLLDQMARGVVLTEVASDGARGIAGGVAEAGVPVVHLRDLFHVVRDLLTVQAPLEKAAYKALEIEERARLVEAEAQTARRRRGPKRTTAVGVTAATAASQAAMQAHDDYAWLIGCVRATLEPVDARTGRLRTTAQSYQEVMAAVALLRESPDGRVTAVAGRLERACPDLVADQERLAQQVAPWQMRWGEETMALLAWAWRHHQELGLTSPAAIAAAFPPEQHDGVRAIWAALDQVHRGSSLVECINSLLRPHLLVHRGVDQDRLDLLACYLNHRVFTRGKRRGQCPLRLAGLPVPADWLVVLGRAPKQPPDSLPTPLTGPAPPQAQTVNRKAA